MEYLLETDWQAPEIPEGWENPLCGRDRYFRTCPLHHENINFVPVTIFGVMSNALWFLPVMLGLIFYTRMY